MQKKSQIHMLETIAVLVIFFILVFIGLVFYTNILRGNIERGKEEVLQLNAIELAQRASFLPELQCSFDNIVRDNCIDILKLEAASDIIQDNEVYYYDRFLFSRIAVSEIYPNEKNWLLYDRPLEGESIVTFVPISLFDPIENKNSFGIMNITMYLR